MFHYFFISNILLLCTCCLRKCYILRYFTAEKTIYNVIVFYDEANKENAQYLVENMEHRDNYITKKYHIDFDEGNHLMFIYLHIIIFCFNLLRFSRLNQNTNRFS